MSLTSAGIPVPAALQGEVASTYPPYRTWFA